MENLNYYRFSEHSFTFPLKSADIELEEKFPNDFLDNLLDLVSSSSYFDYITTTELIVNNLRQSQAKF